MQYIDFAPTGKRTSRIGLGCGRLVGGRRMRHSARLVEAAVALGIRYFDVAPSYGLGTAEDVIGAVVGDSKEITVCTKVGVPRPPYSAKANLLRDLVKPLLDRARPLKELAQRATRRSSGRPEERPRYDFSASGIRASLEESLRRLRRGSVDVFLAHEPHRLDLQEEVAARFGSLRDEGLIGAFGVGVGAVGDRWERFGSIWQSCWPGPSARQYARDVEHIWHGAVRTWHQRPVDRERQRASAVVRMVLEESPSSILLVSASTPRRLTELLAEVNP